MVIVAVDEQHLHRGVGRSPPEADAGSSSHFRGWASAGDSTCAASVLQQPCRRHDTPRNYW
jgi:hypothetical protein